MWLVMNHTLPAVSARLSPRQRLLIWTGVAFMLIYAIGLLTRPGETYLRLQSNLIYNLPGFVALVLVLRRTSSSDRLERWGWRFMAALLLTWQIGDWIYSYYDLALNQDPPFPGIADVFYTLGYASLLVALPLLAYPRRLFWTLRWLIDVLLITTVAGCFAWVVLLKPIVEDGSTSTAASALALSYPLWDLGLLALIFGAMFAWHSNLSRRTLVLLCAMAALVVTDGLNTYGLVESSYQNVGNPLEVGWLLAYMLIGLAAILPANAATSRFERRMPLPWLVFPYLLALPLPIVQAVRAFSGSDVDILALGGALALLLAFASHVQASYMTTRALDDERRKARLDSLTGTLNHGGILEEAEDLLASNRTAALYACVVDVDALKRLNDDYGHRIGDQALRVIASRLRRTGGIVGRYGGDEFLVLFQPHDCLEGRTPEHMLRQALADAFVTDKDGTPLVVSASYGVATYPDEAQDLGRLVELADSAMYARKHLKRRAAHPEPVSGPFGQPISPRAA